jgi:hypothetical protein
LLLCLDSINPHSINPDSINPDSINPDSINPDSINSHSINPDSINPDSINPDSINPDSIKPDSIKPDSINPDSIKPTVSETCTGRHLHLQRHQAGWRLELLGYDYSLVKNTAKAAKMHILNAVKIDFVFLVRLT